MAIHIERLNINYFRGINGLALNGLNHVNIIGGDNNSGKTSVLEAILLLRNPKDFNNVKRIARTRNRGFRISTTSVYEDFINLFPRNNDQMMISLDGVCIGEPVKLCLTGDQKMILLANEELYQSYTQSARHQQTMQYPDGLETSAFKGELKYSFADEHGHVPIDFHKHGRNIIVIDNNYYLNIVYTATVDHIRENIFSKILHDDLYKDICISVLRLFDSQILDILYLRNEDTDRPVEYVKHAVLGNMPLSTFGDGVKKVLSLANGIAQATNGILMIDELETAIHSKYYDEIFRFIIKACKQFQVQLFITTHSIEAIDALLAVQDYDNHDSDDVSVITFQKYPDSQRTYSRTLNGRNVLQNREEFGFEVRL